MPINLGSLAGGFAEQAGAELFAFGVGTAIAEALRPEAVMEGQFFWDKTPGKVLAAGEAAAAVAEGLRDEGWGAGEARQTGIDDGRFMAIVETLRTAPGVPELLTLLRRGAIGDADFVHGLRKAKLEARWDAPIATLKEQRVDPAVIATAVQRGVMHDPGLLPVGPPAGSGVVPPMPVANLDTLREAADSGVSEERLAVYTRIVGLPPAPGELLQLLNRGHIQEVDYRRGIAEGNTRNEWADVLVHLRRRLLTPHEYAELRLRGWIDTPAMLAGARLSGLEDTDTDLLLKMIGRPLTVHQIVTGLARGGAYGGEYEGVPEPYQKALRESNVRPEWGNLAYHNRYNLPSAFVVRALLKDGAIDTARGESIFLQEGWPPDLAKAVAEHTAKGGAAKADTHVGKAENQLWTTIHKSYVDAESDDAEANAALTALGASSDSHAKVLALWQHEREIVRRSLTPSQIKKAWKEAKFTRDEALRRLEHLGMSAADASTLLDE